MGSVADEEAYTVHTIDIISQRRQFAGNCLISYVVKVLDFHSIYVCFPCTWKLISKQNAQIRPDYNMFASRKWSLLFRFSY
jgi:hypothetical protein